MGMVKMTNKEWLEKVKNDDNALTESEIKHMLESQSWRQTKALEIIADIEGALGGAKTDSDKAYFPTYDRGY